jgi:HAD superfamily hydrolase (TIGR01509 family)
MSIAPGFKLEAAILDLDGTLTDSMPKWLVVGAEYLVSQGVQAPDGIAEEIRAMSLEESAEYFKRRFGLDRDVDDIAAGINELMEPYYRERVTVKPGVVPFLEELADRGIPTAVATATDAYLAEYALERVGIRELLGPIVCCADVGTSKDGPEVYETALGKLGTAKRGTMMFDDSLYAVRAAAAAGFPVAGVADDSSSHVRDLIIAASDIYLERLDEALPLL